ncbi:uncharacterized protein SCHCODRAFT_02490642 [Schizophyllum commune H4-8]|nr:uncharacterized protein SCHCODRAFT_02490642 [Schizophyllum commune H4-8]KAI5896760.1 hypothetical protein SCHCODRAFT_02490642 [Schizophyllum commune H4-8]
MLPDVDALLKEVQPAGNLSRHRSGFLPTGQDAAVLEDQGRLMDKADAEYTAAIKQLTRQRARIRNQRAIHRALLSPARRFPQELWSAIFLLALPDDWDLEPVGIRSLALAQVCYAWRYIALNTPRIWSGIHIFAWRRRGIELCDEAIIGRELQKSGQVPLRLTLDMTNYQYELRPTAVPKGISRFGRPRRWRDTVWRLLCAEANRWEAVHLVNLRNLLFHRHSGPFTYPTLRELSWTTRDITKADIVSKSLSLSYQIAPDSPNLPESWSLRALKIVCGRGLAENLEENRLEASDSDSESDVIDDEPPPLAPCLPLILACSATLRTCTVQSTIFGSVPADQPRVTFPVLEKLLLEGGAIQLCRWISAPKLQVVTLLDIAEDEERMEEFEAFIGLLDNSDNCPSLRALALDRLSCSASSVVECLGRLPNLEKLSVINSERFGDESEPEYHMEPPVSYRLIKYLLLPAHGRDTPLRRLTDLQLGYSFGNNHTDGKEEDAVREMVESRSMKWEEDGQPIARLRHFVCDSADESLDRHVDDSEW